MPFGKTSCMKLLRATERGYIRAYIKLFHIYANYMFGIDNKICKEYRPLKIKLLRHGLLRLFFFFWKKSPLLLFQVERCPLFVNTG